VLNGATIDEATGVGEIDSDSTRALGRRVPYIPPRDHATGYFRRSAHLQTHSHYATPTELSHPRDQFAEMKEIKIRTDRPRHNVLWILGHLRIPLMMNGGAGGW
jgi:hypothetical protein